MNIAIIGLGVIGGTFAKAIRASYGQKHRIMAIDVNQETLNMAIADKVIDVGETSNQFILSEADLVIFAIYPNMIKDFILHHRDDFKDGATLTDTAGVKSMVMKYVEEILPHNISFIFGHPMAGREKRGYAYADASVFQGANYIITKSALNSDEAIAAFKEFLYPLGFKRITVTDALMHDEMIAHTSQLTHAIAVSLINSDNRLDETIKYIGDSYRDLTRIANMNESLWSELFIHNKEALLDNMERFEDAFTTLKEAIKNDDLKVMENIFKESSHRRIRLEQSDMKK